MQLTRVRNDFIFMSWVRVFCLSAAECDLHVLVRRPRDVKGYFIEQPLYRSITCCMGGATEELRPLTYIVAEIVRTCPASI